MASPSRLRVVVADDHAIFRDGLRLLLASSGRFDVVGEASDGREAIALTERLLPDLLLLDLSMPDASGLDALRELSAARRSARIVLLAASVDTADIVTALQCGARGVVLKESAAGVLFAAIDAVMRGDYWVGRTRTANLVALLSDLGSRQSAAAAPGRDLTPRERDIISAVVRGLSNREIAAELSMSEQTVKHHITHIFDKVGASNRVELAMFAVHHRLV